MMALVGYSDSESSDAESYPKPQRQSADDGNLRKPAFQKVVDRSNPRKIVVSLPEQSERTAASDGEAAEPLPKRPKLGSGSFSSFNSMLPAPKKTSVMGGGNGESDVRKSGLRLGASLKTGATPGFNRETPVTTQIYENDEPAEETTHAQVNVSSNTESAPIPGSEPSDHLTPAPRFQGNSMIFKPLSVTRKQKKKSSTMVNEEIHTRPEKPLLTINSEQEPRVSLFSTEEADPVVKMSFNGHYQPIVSESSYPSSTLLEPPFSEGENIENPTVSDTGHPQIQVNASSAMPHSLDIIAEDLHLSASARRQLLGRQRNNPSNIKLVNFNIDQEYAANELLRQAGEQVQHNPVRAIAPGKHSLKQLVNAASSQKEALEEHFATGKRNKKEAGSKYGW
jgi:hypothetical protein